MTGWRWLNGPKLVAVAVASCLPLLAASYANADISLFLDDGSGHTASFGPSATGAISTGTISLGVWNIVVATGVAQPPQAGPGPLLDLGVSSAHSTGAGTLTIVATNTGFTGTGILGWVTQIGGTLDNGSVSANAWVDPTNASGIPCCPPLADQVANIGPLSTSPFSATQSGHTQTLSGLFSSTIQVVIAHVAGGNTTLDIKTQVPEPGTLGLLGLGLIAAWGVAARRRA